MLGLINNPRANNRNIYGFPFPVELKDQVWNKGRVITLATINIIRQDIYGNLISYAEYGNIHSEFGWEIDHIKPVALGGTDDLYNLQPLQWHANRVKSDNYPSIY